MDMLTLFALAVAIAVAVALGYINRKKEVPRGNYISEFELSLPTKKDKKQLQKEKQKKAAASRPAGEKAAPIVSRRLKGVEGVIDDANSDAQMLDFLSQKITMDSKGRASTSISRRDEQDEDDEPVKPTKKAPKQPADPVSAGFTAVVERKKPAKKDDEPQIEEPAAQPKKAKAFYKEELEAAKREQEARKAERAEREKQKKERAARGEGSPKNLPPRLQKNADGTESPVEGEGAPRKPRFDGPRPKREFTPVAPPTTEPFEEWSIDSMLDSITNSAAVPAKKKNVKETVEAETEAEAQE